MNVSNNNFFGTIADEFMNALSDADLYKLVDVISVEDAAALIAGVSPNNVYHDYYAGEGYIAIRTNQGDPYNAQEVFSISLKTLGHAIKSGKLNAHIVITPNVESLTQDPTHGDVLLYGKIMIGG